MKMADIFGATFLDSLKQTFISILVDSIQDAIPELTAPENNSLISRPETARRLGVTKDVLDKMVTQYQIPYHHPSDPDTQLFIYSDVIAAIRSGSSYARKPKTRKAKQPKVWLQNIIES